MGWKEIRIAHKFTIYFVMYAVLGLIIGFSEVIRSSSFNFINYRGFHVPYLISIIFIPASFVLFITQEFSQGGHVYQWLIISMILDIIIFGTFGFLVGYLYEKIFQKNNKLNG